MTKQERLLPHEKGFVAGEDPANQDFMCLCESDNAELVGYVKVDSGQIELGDCSRVDVTVRTAYGDLPAPVWRGDKYIIIEHNMFNILKLDEEMAALETEAEN